MSKLQGFSARGGSGSSLSVPATSASYVVSFKRPPELQHRIKSTPSSHVSSVSVCVRARPACVCLNVTQIRHLCARELSVTFCPTTNSFRGRTMSLLHPFFGGADPWIAKSSTKLSFNVCACPRMPFFDVFSPYGHECCARL
uniref:(northern house mosquito) hypothetical protein n=1 Tax=Culex pipiens TaxID=7175 RepID=A0A8D8B8X5_CULPI